MPVRRLPQRLRVGIEQHPAVVDQQHVLDALERFFRGRVTVVRPFEFVTFVASLFEGPKLTGQFASGGDLRFIQQTR